MARKAREELKKLESMRATLEAEISAMAMEEKVLKQDICSKKQVLNQIKQKINSISINNGYITVSEHAIIRYSSGTTGKKDADVTKTGVSENSLYIVVCLSVVVMAAYVAKRRNNER